MIKKLKDIRGYSLSEMLMVTLIVALVAAVLGGGVMVVKDAYQRITLKAEAQTLLSTTITELTDEFRFAEYIENNDPTAPDFVSGNLGYRISFENGSGNQGEKGIMIKTAAGDRQLLADGVMTSSLVPQIEYSYDEENNLFVATVTIKHGDNHSYMSQEIKVCPINEKAGI